MPLFEYVCTECGHKFEKLILSSRREREIHCPTCQSKSVNKAFSIFGTNSGSANPSASNCAPSG